MANAVAISQKRTGGYVRYGNALIFMDLLFIRGMATAVIGMALSPIFAGTLAAK